MNKIIFTNDRLFMALVGPGGSGKTRLIYSMLASPIFYPPIEKWVFRCGLTGRFRCGWVTGSCKDIAFRPFKVIEQLFEVSGDSSRMMTSPNISTRSLKVTDFLSGGP